MPDLPVPADNAYFWSNELKHCQKSFLHLATNYLHVKSKQKVGFPTLELNHVQRYLYNAMLDQHRRTGFVRQIWGKSRQIGASTLSLALMFWRTAFHDHYNAFTMSYDEPTAVERFDVLATFLDALPDPLKPTTKYRSKFKMAFENRNSRILTGHANNPNVGAGEMNHFVHLTEAARYPHADLLQASLFPTISEAKGPVPSIVIIESTSFFGGNWFKRMGDEAIAGNSQFEFHFIPWHMHEVYRTPVPQGFQLTASERFVMSQHNLTIENMVWRRHKMSEYIGNPELFFQEFPLCLVGSTRISTQRGLIPLVEAIPGDVTESGEILNWLPQGTAPVYTLTTKLGYQITGTAQHKLKQVDGSFVKLGEAHGAILQLEPPRFAEDYHTVRWYQGPVESSMVITPEFGRWLGYFAGDGCFSPVKGGKVQEGGQGTVSIVCDEQDTDVCEDVEKLFQTVWSVNAIARTPNRAKAVEFRSSSVRWVGPLLQLGVIHRTGVEHRWKRNVCVPEAIWRSPKSVVREFLRGLYESDGSASKAGDILLFSIHREFLRDVQLLLLGFGITTKLTQWQGKKDQHSESWTLHCRKAESELFEQAIGFVSQRKQQRLTVRRKNRGRPRYSLVYTDSVASIIPAGTAPVYDLTLPAPHTFSANGICVHNSWEESWIMPQGSSRTFPDAILAYLPELIRPGRTAWTGSEGLKFYLGGHLEVWAEPVEGAFYDIGIDPAGGKHDYTVIEVVRRDTLEQVAEARGQWDPASQEFLDLVFWTGMIYNRAQLIPDVTGGWGHALMNDLQRRGYPNLWLNRRRDDTTGKVSNRAGFHYTKRDKSLLVTNAAQTLIRDKPRIHSQVLVQELRDFLTIGPDEWAARTGCYDDATNAYMLALLSATDDRSYTSIVTEEPGPPRESIPLHQAHNIDAELEEGGTMGSAMEWLQGETIED
ncbi:MAG: LAGLIDADG family homing endonuclease [Cetobacterium sp.]